MDPRAALVAAKLLGRMSVVLGIGRLDYVGRFQPFGQVELCATVSQGPEGLWTVSVGSATVPYQHPSPRIVTHVGMFLYDRWLVDEMPKGKTLLPGDAAVLTAEYPLPEIL